MTQISLISTNSFRENPCLKTRVIRASAANFGSRSFRFGVPRLRGRLKAELQTFRKVAHYPNFRPLDLQRLLWEIPHVQTTLVKADDKNRVSIRGTRKGRQYLVTARHGGWWVMPAPKVKTPARAWESIVADTWNKLGPAPEIDYDQI